MSINYCNCTTVALQAQFLNPLALQNLAQKILSLKLEANKAVDQPTADTYTSLCESLNGAAIGLRTKRQTRNTPIQRRFGIRAESLRQIAQLGTENRGYVERLVAEINHRIDETLDITHFWQQDDEFRLTIDYKSGFFYFEITDKTGAKYTFNERSSGLRYS